MPQSTQRAHLHLTEQQKVQLKQLSGSRTAPVREVQRAQVLLQYAEGRPIVSISHQLRISRPSLYKCIDRALAAGVEVALKDKYHRPKAPVISAEAKAWVLHLACSKPTEHGYAAEVWSCRPWPNMPVDTGLRPGIPHWARPLSHHSAHPQNASGPAP